MLYNQAWDSTNIAKTGVDKTKYSIPLHLLINQIIYIPTILEEQQYQNSEKYMHRLLLS